MATCFLAFPVCWKRSSTNSLIPSKCLRGWIHRVSRTWPRNDTQSQQDIAAKLDRLEKKVAANQEETAQVVMKRIKRYLGYQFCGKGNEKQFIFNDGGVNDFIRAVASDLLEKLKSTSPQDNTILKSAKE